jgi:hypothetical protein
MRKYFFQTLIVLATAAVWTGCDDDDDEITGDRYSLSGPASGTQERPIPVNTPATGNITGTYRAESNILDYTITWNNLSVNPLMMHFHGPATVDTFAGVQRPINGVPQTTSGTVSGVDTLTAEQETQLLSGLWYYNIHTQNHMPGEIRGQITATKQ